MSPDISRRRNTHLPISIISITIQRRRYCHLFKPENAYNDKVTKQKAQLSLWWADRTVYVPSQHPIFSHGENAISRR